MKLSLKLMSNAVSYVEKHWDVLHFHICLRSNIVFLEKENRLLLKEIIQKIQFLAIDFRFFNHSFKHLTCE